MLKKPVIGFESMVSIIESVFSNDDARIEELVRESDNRLRGIAKYRGPRVLVSLDDPLYNHLKTHSSRRIEEERISEDVRGREEQLFEYFEETTKTTIDFDFDEAVFVVGRRWNSWYPSFFDVPGGAYGIVGPLDDRERHHASVIDPGFRSLEVLRSLGLSLAEISTCVITHNHPDHLGGIFEYLAGRHALSKKSTLFCNRAVRRMMEGYVGFGLELKELDKGPYDLLDFEDAKRSHHRIQATCFPTSHSNIGPTDDTKGIILTYERTTDSGQHDVKKLVVLGDTEYEPEYHADLFLRAIADPEVSTLVLHIGSSQLKSGTGKHLYLPGLNRLLRGIEGELVRQPNHKMTILVSEWGLEHATGTQIAKICGESIPTFKANSPIMDTIEFLRGQLYESQITVLPADIGLFVGMRTGKIYIDGNPVDPNDVESELKGTGISYQRTT
jgi:hypothetical protein